MRQIKFRAWVTAECRRGYKAHQMLSWSWIQNELISDMKFGKIFFEGKTIIPMQFTGLLDKNGKEIWEGDIVQYTNASGSKKNSGGKKMIYPVCYIKGSFVTKQKKKNLDGEEWGLDLGNYLCVQDDISGLEVIGNIYENPELLK